MTLADESLRDRLLRAIADAGTSKTQLGADLAKKHKLNERTVHRYLNRWTSEKTPDAGISPEWARRLAEELGQKNEWLDSWRPWSGRPRVGARGEGDAQAMTALDARLAELATEVERVATTIRLLAAAQRQPLRRQLLRALDGEPQ